MKNVAGIAGGAWKRVLCWLSLLLAPFSAAAQVVADGATNTLSNVTNTITGDVTVGTNGSFTLLVLSDNVLLTNSGNGVIGLNATAKSNEVRLLSPSARWQVGGSLFIVGSNGSFNRLVVSNGATVRDAVAFVGENASASNNLALVTGSGSTWNAGVAYLGFFGAGNQLVVSNGGAVLDDFGYVGVAGSNNLAVVTGSGSTWTNGLDLQIGNNGAGNELLVSNGGAVWNGQGYIGANTPASNNLALITGAGSLWSNALDLNIGAFSANNQMIVSNGATVFAAGHGFIGSATNASGNLVTLTDPGTRWLVGTNLYVGSNGSFNRLVVSNGATARDNLGVLGFNTISSNNLAVVTGSGSLWSNASELYVGFQGAGNQLVVSNGATVRNTSGYLGPAAGGSNTAVVTDAGSLWSNANDLFVGVFGAGDRLVVSNGALVRNNYGFVGVNTSSSNNAALVTGFGSVWTNAQDLYIGDFGLGNQLVVSNGGTVFTAGKGFIGFNSTASSNSVTVTDPGTRWLGGLFSDLYVGSNSPFNRLVVSNGGLVANNAGFLGHAASGNSNLVLVTGAGSIWSNRSILEMGERGSGNRLVISNGGLVHASGFGRIGRIAGTNNDVVVTGPGSSWNISSGSLTIGESASSNRLQISNGGSVRSQFAELGTDVGSNNEAVVTGSGSVWTNSEAFSVGLYGNRNRLVVSNAATVYSGTSMTIGEQTIGTNNRVVVDGGALLVTNAAGTGVLEARRGTNVLNAGSIEADQLLVTNRLGFFEFNGGTLITRGAFISNNAPFFVGLSGATPAVWDVRAGPSNHIIMDFLDLGFFASFNQLLVTNGAVLSNQFDGIIGVNPGANSNTATVSGTDSRWESGNDLQVGFGGSFNRLLLSNAGLVVNSNAWLGASSGASNNLALVTGVNSVWSNRGTMFLGFLGGGNQLVVSNGGVVANTFGEIGSRSESSNNLALVMGTGSVLSNTSYLYVGTSGSGNRLVAANGGVVRSDDGYIGGNPSSSNNLALVTGSGSLWTNLNDLYVGLGGSGNQLVVSNGGVLRNSAGYLGGNSSSSNNQALVMGSGSLWSNRSELHVGDSGSRNLLVVSNGGTVFNGAEGIIGTSSGANSNSVIVTDAGSIWLGTGGLYVGNNGGFNRLVVTNGGLAAVSGEVTRIGSASTANSNQAVVTGPGSTWSNQFDLLVGESGSANLLVVSNGGLVVSSNGTLGSSVSSSNNVAMVTGSGSVWSNVGDLYVGLNGRSNQLLVSNGGVVLNRDGELGRGSSGTNLAVVTGAGSLWTISGNLLLGRSGSGNQLVVSNGATVLVNGDTFFSISSTESNNVAIVTGSGSLWSNASNVVLGDSGRANRMVVGNGGVARDSRCYLGFDSSGNSGHNTALVTDPGSLWNHANDLEVGYFGAGNQLVVSNGGVVFAGNEVRIGVFPASINNRIEINGGSLLLSNAFSTALFDIRRGTNVLNAGLIDVQSLLLTNTLGLFEFNGGTLRTAGTTVSNGRVFTVGNGTSAATLQLQGGTHLFSNNLVVASSASIIGNGTIIGSLTVQSGGALAPGTSIGKLVLSNSPALQGATIMEISRNGSAVTNDQVQIAGALTYGGALTVTNIGPDALTVGNRFPLFSASSYSGSFSSLTLPPLPSGFIWTNKLALDGSLEVTLPSVTLTIQRSNNVLTLSWPTNASSYCLETAYDVTPPVLWQSVLNGIVTNVSSFRFSLTNTLGTPKQFFRLAFPCSTNPTSVSLSIQLSNNVFMVSWPSNAFRLETAFTLAPPVSWQTISNGLSNSGSLRTFSFTNNPGIPNQFFRLAFP